MVHVVLPGHLRRLAGISAPVVPIKIDRGDSSAHAPVSLGDVLDALEQIYPPLKGVFYETIPISDEKAILRLRVYLRFFAGKYDLTPRGPTAPLPPEVISGKEPLRIVGAIAGGQGR